MLAPARRILVIRVTILRRVRRAGAALSLRYPRRVQWGRLAIRAACAAALGGALGCAALPWPSGPDRPDEAVPAGAYYDLRGAVHVHTRASHDSHGEIGDL